MKQHLKLQRWITSAAEGFALIASAYCGLAQNTNPTNTFDNAASTTSFVQQFGSPTVTMTWDGTRDAGNNTNSGSVRYVAPFTSATSGQQFQTFFTIANRWQYDGGYTLDARTYTNYSFDIKVDPATAPTPNRDFGTLQIGLETVSNSWLRTYLTEYVIPLTATNWTHVDRALSPSLANISQVVGFFYKMASTHTNTLTFNIDNVMLAKPPPAGTPTGPQISLLTPAQTWQRLEFRISNVPSATNQFDPDLIRLDAAITLPSGRTMVVPGFWYQAYQRSLSGGYEHLTAAGSAEWRVRFTPPEPGTYNLSLTIRTNGQVAGGAVTTNFIATAATPLGRTGYVRIGASKAYFETGDGQALRLIGENVCWPGNRGTYDYDTWFPALQAAGGNYARLWMCPWAFGLEADQNSLNRYHLDSAWQLDYVLQLAEQRGIYLMFCLDYHGMFEVTSSSDTWTNNPYNALNGGPCLNQNAFFTNATAKTLYQKRLRYLVARYGYSPNLLVWQLFNEIDNVYAYLKPNDVAAWHGVMGGWLHTNDPFGHLVSTSLGSGGDRPELWTLPQLDFATYHSYGEPSPASRFSTVAQSSLQRYGKPVLIDEFGIDVLGWNRTNDPYLRGFRQGLWGGALSGSVGTGMSWWWENIQSENVYPAYAALGAILNRTGWGTGGWTNIGFKTSGPPPATVGDLVPGGQPFDAFLVLNAQWGAMASGQLAVVSPAATGYSAATLDSYVHGTGHPDLRVPFRLSAWLTNNARLVLHLNSVSSGSILVVRVDSTELYRTNLPNLDGGYNLNNEYSLDIPVALPAGKRLIEITNDGIDWFFLDWVRLEQVLPATYPGDWQPSPEAIALRGPRESLLYVVAPGASFPASATNASLPLQQGQTVILTNWPAGGFLAEWYDPATAAQLGLTVATSTNGSLTLPLPGFREDLAAIVYPPPRLTALGFSGSNGFQMRLDSETGGQYWLHKSADLSAWVPLFSVTNASGATVLTVPPDGQPAAFFQARKTIPPN